MNNFKIATIPPLFSVVILLIVLSALQFVVGIDMIKNIAPSTSATTVAYFLGYIVLATALGLVGTAKQLPVLVRTLPV